jgi:hypothetical protein
MLAGKRLLTGPNTSRPAVIKLASKAYSALIDQWLQAFEENFEPRLIFSLSYLPGGQLVSRIITPNRP